MNKEQKGTSQRHWNSSKISVSVKSASGCEGDFLLESDFLFENKKSDSSKKSTWISMPRLVPFYHLLGNKKYPVICILLSKFLCFKSHILGFDCLLPCFGSLAPARNPFIRSSGRGQWLGANGLHSRARGSKPNKILYTLKSANKHVLINKPKPKPKP